MDIEFTCTTNRDICMINTADFCLSNGTSITIDRDNTEWSIEGNTLSMTFKNCYLWGINGFNIFDGSSLVYLTDYGTEEFRKLVEDSTVFLELEDDAPYDDYKVEVTGFSII